MITNPSWIELLNSYFIPLWMISPKEDEFKPMSELMDGKIRTFIIPPTNLLYWQLRLFSNQNEAMKNHLWSSYGINPFGGGANRLAKELERFPFRGCMDWSGYDRLLPFLKYVYMARVHHLIVPEDIPSDRVEWTVEHTVKSYLIDPDGDVFYKWWGNNSGSGNTTCDNICAAELLVIYSMVRGDPSTSMDDLTNEVCYHLYGDDEAHSVSEKYKFLCDEQWLKNFARHVGMEIKFFNGGENYPIEKMSFLGFKYRKRGAFWIPRFDDDKILFSLVHTYKTLTIEQFVSKVYALTLLSFGTDIFPLCQQFLGDLLYSLRSSTDVTIRAYVMRGVPTSQYLHSFYTNSEHSVANFQSHNLFGMLQLLEATPKVE